MHAPELDRLRVPLTPLAKAAMCEAEGASDAASGERSAEQTQAVVAKARKRPLSQKRSHGPLKRTRAASAHTLLQQGCGGAEEEQCERGGEMPRAVLWRRGSAHRAGQR